MLSQAKIKQKNIFSSCFFKNNKGVSEVIGYVLLIAVSIAVSILVYSFLKTYVPKETVSCADGTSMIVKNMSCTNQVLSITITNNGRFGINGYYIHISTDPSQKLATTDISAKVNAPQIASQSAVEFSGTVENGFAPGSSVTSNFDAKNLGTIYVIEITPTRQEVIDSVKRFASCTDSKITWKNTVNC